MRSTAMTNAIETHDLCVRFGEFRALDRVSLTVPTGSIYGFVGANGAGKTTMLTTLAGLRPATSGTATVLGTERGRLPARPIDAMVYVPDVCEFSPRRTARDELLYLAALSRVPREIAQERATDLLDLVGLRRAGGYIGGFSRGMKQRLAIAGALISAPQLIVVDEPTSALDPNGRADVLAVIRALRGVATVMLSTHQLHDLEQVATHIGVLHDGRLLAEGPVERVLAEWAPSQQADEATWLVRCGSDADLSAALASAGLPEAKATRTDNDRLNLQEVYERILIGHGDEKDPGRSVRRELS